MGTPTWAFTESWSSTLTFGGAFLTSLLGFAALPDQGHTFSKSSYTLLSLLFAALIGLAPGVYNLFRAPVQVRTDATTLTIQYQGVVALFLVAGVFTMTGVLAQLSLLGCLFSDLATAGLMSTPTASAFRRLSVVLLFALGFYAVISAAQTVIYQSAPERQGDSKAEKGVSWDALRKTAYLRGQGPLSGDEGKGIGGALPDWRLL